MPETNHRRRVRPDDEDGASLTETVVAVALAIAVIAGFVTSATIGLRQIRDNNTRNLAQQILAEAMESVWQVEWANLGVWSADGVPAPGVAGETPVVLEGVPPGDRTRLLPSARLARGGVDFDRTVTVTELASPATGYRPGLPQAAGAGTRWSPRRVSVRVRWGQGTVGQVTGELIRSPQPSEMTPARVPGGGPAGSCTPGLPEPLCQVTVAGGNLWSRGSDQPRSEWPLSATVRTTTDVERVSFTFGSDTRQMAGQGRTWFLMVDNLPAGGIGEHDALIEVTGPTGRTTWSTPVRVWQPGSDPDPSIRVDPVPRRLTDPNRPWRESGDVTSGPGRLCLDRPSGPWGYQPAWEVVTVGAGDAVPQAGLELDNGARFDPIVSRLPAGSGDAPGVRRWSLSVTAGLHPGGTVFGMSGDSGMATVTVSVRRGADGVLAQTSTPSAVAWRAACGR